MIRYLVARCKNPQCRQLFRVQELPLPNHDRWTTALNNWPLKRQCEHCKWDNEILESDLAIGEIEAE
jgi:hypothetical protein